MIVLSYHVDYFNGAWKDPFSSREWTERQRRYVTALKERSLYTPMMVVAGREAGYSTAAMGRAMEARRKEVPAAEIRLKARSEGKTLHVEAFVHGAKRDSVPPRAKVWIALAEDRLSTRPQAGENRSVELEENAVVRRLLAGKAPGAELRWEVEVDPAWKLENLRAVAFLQDTEDLSVHAVTETQLAAK